MRSRRRSGLPASVFVVTGEDIRRAGVTSLPEALRLAPARWCALPVQRPWPGSATRSQQALMSAT
jgi:hypothetical protein